MLRQQMSRIYQVIASVLCDVEVEMTAVSGGNECDVAVIRRISRLDIDIAVRGERGFLASLQVDLPQLESVVLVTGEYNVSAIMGPVRLIVVASRVGEFLRLITAHGLSPKRTTHTVDHLLAIRRKRQRRWASRQLWQIHLTIIVIVRQLNLLQHRLPISQHRQRRE